YRVLICGKVGQNLGSKDSYVHGGQIAAIALALDGGEMEGQLEAQELRALLLGLDAWLHRPGAFDIVAQLHRLEGLQVGLELGHCLSEAGGAAGDDVVRSAALFDGMGQRDKRAKGVAEDGVARKAKRGGELGYVLGEAGEGEAAGVYALGATLTAL